MPILIGGLIGILLSAGVSRVLSSMLFGLSPHDPIAFIGVPLFLFAVAASRVSSRLAAQCELIRLWR